MTRAACLIEGCNRPSHGRGWCKMHHHRWLRTGDPETVRPPGFPPSNAVGYGTAHERVRKARGSATEHRCADCGSPAAEWSYTHDDPNEKTAQHGRYVVAYSLDPTYYVPRCLPCHRRLDRGLETAT